MPIFDMTESAFLSDEFDVWSIGVPPVKIEVMTVVAGLDFNETFALSEVYEESGLPIRFINLDHLIIAKKAAVVSATSTILNI